MSLKKVLTTLSLIGLTGTLIACHQKEDKTAQAHSEPATPEIQHLSIGYQKAALKLIVAKKNKIFEQEFP
ncbi:MAG: aliphatic sulfonates ABC transporter substrate-binding protein, partial [Acinetobacter sp.]